MSVYSTSFLEIYARHAVPVVPWMQRWQTNRVEVVSPRPAATLVIGSPMAPPYQVYPARELRENDRRVA